MVDEKEHHLIRSGLASEYFLLSFIKPDIPYKIAKIIKNTEKMPDTSKIYPAKVKLVKEGYLEKKGSKFYPNFKKLSQGMSMLLIEKEKTVNDIELRLIESLLKNSKFFENSPDLIQKIRKQQKGEHDIDALQIIASRIGAMAMGGLMMRKFDNTYYKKNKSQEINSLEEFEQALEDISEIWNEQMFDQLQEHMKEEIINGKLKDMNPMIRDRMMAVILPVFKSMSFGVLFFGPEDFLKKLSILSEGTDVVDIVDHFSKFQKK